MKKKLNIFLAFFFLAITLGTKNAQAQQTVAKPNAPYTADVHAIALRSNLNFSQVQFFVSQTVWLTKNDNPNRAENGKGRGEKGKMIIVDLRYELGAERKGTVSRVDSMNVSFYNGVDMVSANVPVLFISFHFGTKKNTETITIPFVMKPVISPQGFVLDWRKSITAQFEIAPFFSVSGEDFTKKQDGMDYFRVTGKAVAEINRENINILKQAIDKKVQ